MSVPAGKLDASASHRNRREQSFHNGVGRASSDKLTVFNAPIDCQQSLVPRTDAPDSLQHNNSRASCRTYYILLLVKSGHERPP